MINFPTTSHEQVFNKTVEFLKQRPDVGAVTIGGSLARDKATADSDVDINAYLKSNDHLVKEKLLNDFNEFHQTLMQINYPKVGKYFHVGFDIRALDIEPASRGWTTGPDEYEVEIGNAYIHCQLIYEHNALFTKTQSRYTPYYNETLRQKRLKQVLMYCNNNLGHAEMAAQRGLYFHAFKRLHDANREFLQALFISRKMYPIAYDKWIKEQLVDILQLPDLYDSFVHLYELQQLESKELLDKSKLLSSLVAKYIS